jgi:vitamin B12 transporter
LDTSAQFSLLYVKARNSVGDLQDVGLSIDTWDSVLLSSLSVKSRLSDAVSVKLSGRTEYKWSDYITDDLFAGTETAGNDNDRKYGASAKVVFRQGMHSVVAGADYDFYNAKAVFLPGSVDEHIVAAYVNDTIRLGKLTIIPGIRFDGVDVEDSSLKTNFFNPNLGMTYEIAD